MTHETALVTGTSSGIGMELARLLAAEGTKLILVARREENLNLLAAELQAAHGGEVHVLRADLSQRESPQRIFEFTQHRQLTVDLLVNNAGFGELGGFALAPAGRLVDIVRVNMEALTALTRLFLPGMLERGRGGVLNVGSTAGFQPGPGMAVYYASKAYVVSLSEALAEECQGSGVQVSCLCPGPTKTEFGDESGMKHARVFKLGMLDAASVARAGLRGLRRGQVIVMPGLLNNVAAFAVRLAPRFVVRKIVALLNARS